MGLRKRAFKRRGRAASKPKPRKPMGRSLKKPGGARGKLPTLRGRKPKPTGDVRGLGRSVTPGKGRMRGAKPKPGGPRGKPSMGGSGGTVRKPRRSRR